LVRDLSRSSRADVMSCSSGGRRDADLSVRRCARTQARHKFRQDQRLGPRWKRRRSPRWDARARKSLRQARRRRPRLGSRPMGSRGPTNIAAPGSGRYPFGRRSPPLRGPRGAGKIVSMPPLQRPPSGFPAERQEHPRQQLEQSSPSPPTARRSPHQIVKPISLTEDGRLRAPVRPCEAHG
jgi:hypothetical protein